MPAVCVIVPGMPASEDEWFLPYLVEYLRRLQQHADVRVYTLKHPGRPARYQVHGIPVTSFKRGWIRMQSNVMSAVLDDHAKLRFTHIHAVWANTAGFFGAMVARNLKLPFVVTMAGEELVNQPAIRYGAMRRWRTKPILRYVFSTADAVISPSNGTTAKLIHKWRLPAAKLVPVWFGVDTERFRPADTPPPGPLHIISVGGLIPVKRHSLLLKAFALVTNSIEDARLTIVGEGSQRARLEALAAELGIAERVSFPGWLHHDTMPGLYRSAHVAAVTSHHEELPVSIFEALASGLHAVSVNTGIAYDLYERGLFPITVADPDPQSFANGILAAWPECRDSAPAPLSPEATRLISVDTTVQQMLEVFDTVRR